MGWHVVGRLVIRQLDVAHLAMPTSTGWCHTLSNGGRRGNGGRAHGVEMNCHGYARFRRVR